MPIPPLRTSLPRPGVLSNLIPSRRQPASHLIGSVEKYLDSKAVNEIHHAYRFGAEAHEGQFRRSGEPYIIHPLAVATILADMRLDSRSIIAAILHDVIEDTGVTKADLAENFGNDVADLVDGVSKINQIKFETREHAEAENFRKMLLAMSRDIRVILIKLADRIHNMRTLEVMPQNKRLKISRQTLEIYAPIANRLGMYRWSRELEDLSFKFLHPKRYHALAKTLRRRQGNRKSTLKKLRVTLENQLARSGLTAQVIGREKNIFSIYRKMKRKRTSFHDIQDIYAFRIVVETTDDCYRTLGIVHSLYKPIPGRFKDYVAIPKVNGYQSLHTTVFGPFGETFEVQIRTEEMNRIAEAGVASHWLYKSDGKKGIEPKQLAQQWLLDLLDTQQEAGNPGEFLEHLKIDLFPDEIYVFTPKGDIRKLPQGATALDFAYAVHTELGNRCVGAQVNNIVVPLHTVLRSGENVEVVTSRSARPSPSWLKFVVTGKARANIRGFLKKQESKDAIRLGKRLLERELKAVGFSVRKISQEQKDTLLNRLSTPNWRRLLEDIGLGKRLPNVVARQVMPDSTDADNDKEIKPLAIHGTEGMLLKYAKCCYPIPGDPIIGFLGSGRGIAIHTTDCPNIGEFRKHPEKWIHINWAEDVEGRFPVNVRLEAVNKPGVLAKLATIIAEQEANIRNLNMVEHEAKHTLYKFIIEVADRSHLAQILRQLRNNPMVLRIARVKG